MASVFALRAILGACLGMGALDLVWINAALAPRLFEREPEPAPPTPAITTIEPVVPPPAIEPAPTITIEPVYFATMSAVIDAKTRTELDRVIERAGTESIIVLEGHADHRGDEALNQTLSKDRASAVRNYLVRRGLPGARIRVGYVGEARASGELWRDRRVDIQITEGPP